MLKDKYYNSTSSLVMGVVLILMSMILFVFKGQFYRLVIQLVMTIFFIKFLLDMYQLFFNWKNIAVRNRIFVLEMFHLGTCLIFFMVPNLFYGLAPALFSIYLFLIGLSQFIMCFLEIRNGDFIRVKYFVVGVFCLVIAIPIFTNPVIKMDNFILCLAIYMLFLGGYYLYDFIMLIVPMRTKNNLKRRIRITLPTVVEAIIPYSVMVEINRNLEVRKTDSYSFLDTNRESDLNILIHTSNRGVNRMGHLDIYFEGKVISYGNYDEGSRYFHELFGDGVLFMADDKAKYINFCIDNSKKMIFDFGIILTDRQKMRIRKRIDEILSKTVSWDYKDDRKYNNGTSYAAKLYKRTRAQFYKFKKGKYRTYYVLGTNCCYLVDDILGKSGMDILSINGIISPGTYYDYLNRELRRKNGNVISKEVYSSKNKAK